jgi:photosystem II stability/assembly factor-like uncharacterized protein
MEPALCQVGVWKPIGPTNATVLAIQQDPFSSSTLYAGVYFGGLFKSTDSGQRWTSISSPFTSDVVFVLACDPATRGTIYIGTFQRGLYKTTDGGITWTSINSGITTMDDEALGVDPTNPQNLIVGSGGKGYRSTDGGMTWKPISLHVRTAFFDPVHAGVVYVGTYTDGLFKSTDHGATFSSFSTGIGTNTVLSMHQSQDGNSLYAAALQGVFERDLNDTAWRNVTADLPWDGTGDILSLPQSPNTLVGGTSQGVYTLDKSATNPTWTNISTVGTRFLYAPSSGKIWMASSYSGLYATSSISSPFVLSQNGMQNYFVEALFAGTSSGSTTLFAGTDHGVFDRSSAGNWSNSSDLTHETIFTLAQHPTQTATVFAGTQSSGVWKSTDLGNHWSSLATGLVPRQVTSIAQFFDVKQVVLAGSSSGVYQSLDNGQTWKETLLLSGVLSLATDPSIQASAYVGAAGGQVLRTTDYGNTFNPVQASGLPASDVLALTVIPYDKIYAVLANGEAYATYTSGSSWLRMNGDSPYPIRCVTGDSKDIKTTYMGTSGGGVYQTTDFGQTWVQANFGLSGLYIYSIAVDPTNSNVVYAATNTGVYKSTNKASSWQVAGSGLPSAPIISMIVDPKTPGNITVSVLDQGVYRTMNGGVSWQTATTGPPTSGAVSLALNPLFPETLYAGTLKQGIYISSDHGDHWQASNGGLSVFIRGLVVDSQNPSNMYAASLTDGFFRTTNGGTGWSNVALNDRNLFGLAIDPNKTGTLYAATSIGVTRSTDSGSTWQDLGQHNPYLFSMVVDSSNSQVIYTGSTQGKIYKSTNGGVTWAEASTGLPLGDVVALAQNGTNHTLYASINLNGIYVSTNGGTSWKACGVLPSLVTASTTGLSLDSATGYIYVAGDSVGVFRSVDACQNWQSSNAGVATAQIRSLLASRRQASLVFAGTAVAGIYRSTDGAASWNPVVNRPTGTVVLSIAEDPVTAGLFYLGTDTGVFRSTDYGMNWSSISNGLPSGVGVTSILPIGGSTTIYAVCGASGLFASNNSGTSWTAVATTASQSVIRALGSGSSSQTLYAATLGSGFILSTNKGQSWTPEINLANVQTVTNVVIVDPTNSNTIYSATGGSGVQKSTDGGATWVSKVSGLPQLYIVAMVMDPVDHLRLYVGTAQGGVFQTKDGGETWSALNNGLYHPNVVSLAVDSLNHNIVYAGTEGAGVFQIQVQ